MKKSHNRLKNTRRFFPWQPIFPLVAEAKIIFVSHRWLRPGNPTGGEELGFVGDPPEGGGEENSSNPNSDAGAEPEKEAEVRHPDDEESTVFKLICEGCKQLHKRMRWKKEHLYLWIDYACVDQVGFLGNSEGGGCLRNIIYELADPYSATINVNVKLCHQFWEEKGRGVVLQQPVCLVLNCTIGMGREWPGRCIAPTGVLNICTIARLCLL